MTRLLAMLTRRTHPHARKVCPVCGTPHEPKGELILCACSETIPTSALVRRMTPQTRAFFFAVYGDIYGDL